MIKAKEYLANFQGGSWLIAEVDEYGNLNRDRASVIWQSHTKEEGFNKSFKDKDPELMDMMDICKEYVQKFKRGNQAKRKRDIIHCRKC